MKPVDSHCHINFGRFDDDRDEVIRRIQENLELAVVPGVNLRTNREVLKLCEGENYLIPNVGLHPLYIEKSNPGKVMELIKEQKPPAIGEIGLDHHYSDGIEEKERQETVFSQMLKISREIRSPPVIHSRDAERRCFEMVSSKNLDEAFFHCFNGSVDLVREITSEGYHVGVTTQVLQEDNVQEIVRETDLENLMLETDSPYLYPGGRNEPVNVGEVAETISEIKDIPEEEVIGTTTRNAINFFEIDDRKL